MEYKKLGKSGLRVSQISFGASALGGVFKAVDEDEGIRTVHQAVEAGINYFDVAPAYGGTLAETILGKALKSFKREQYFLSTKAGKYTAPGAYGQDDFDYSESRIRAELDKSRERLGVDFVDVVHLHDFDYQGGKNAAAAFDTGFATLVKLKEEGVIGAVSAGIYVMDLWLRVIDEAPVDTILLHNHYCLTDTRGLELVEACQQKEIGIINASPFASGLLTPGPVADWHPANREQRGHFADAAAYCESQGFSLAKLAFQFATQQDYFPTTMFSSSNTRSLTRNLAAYLEPVDPAEVKKVQEILSPVMNLQWDYDAGSGLEAEQCN
jgi:L-galactose dehydrogenase